MMGDLTLSIDNYLNDLFEELANHYPQAPPVGATARMKDVIVGVNRSQDESNDLIFANKISIEKYSKANDPQDYTGFVMEVINKAIQITGETIEQDETIAQKHHHFAQSLFAFANHTNCKAIIEILKEKSEEITQRQFFFHMLNNKMNEIGSKSIQQIRQFKQDWKEQARKEHKYGIAQKIPTHVKPFSNADFKECNFSINNSSILRIMTKWAEYLEDIFEKPQVQLAQRLYDFKTFQGQLKQFGQFQRSMVIKNLSKQYEHVKTKLQELKAKNTLFQSFILSQSERGSSYLKRFTQARAASAQMNAFTIEFTRKYLCILMYHLVKSGSRIINLVVFRVGDLLRSKLQCNQKTFINVINTLSLLDEAKQMQGKFKLVRVKNKLNIRDNNVLINYMFMGKVQCELQLSIQKMDKKDQNYYAFCHFLYELTRGKLGVLTECATIVCQHDPIVSASKEAYYRPKCYEILNKQKSVTHKIHEKNEDIYECLKCGQLRIRENINLFNRQQKNCNQCIIEEQNPENKFHSQKGMKQFKEYIEPLLLQGILEMREQINMTKFQAINGKFGSKVRMYKALKPAQQNKLFLIQINQNVLEKFDQEGFEYSSIDYFDISSKVKKKIPLKELTYKFKQQIYQDDLQIAGINPKNFEKMDKIFAAWQNFRYEKNLIKSIKFKSDIIDLKTKVKLEILNNIVRAYSDNQAIKALMYKKYNVLEWQNIYHIKFADLELSVIPQIFKNTNCKSIDLRGNKFDSINLQNHTKLQKLDMDGNLLREAVFQNNQNLLHLRLGRNKLEKIDLSKAVNLKYLSLNYNVLQQIDLSNNTKLQQLWLSDNKFQHLNLAKNTALQTIFLHGNKLQQIDLSNNKNLKNITSYRNQLTQIDLSNNLSLKVLKLDKNLLKSIDLCFNTNLVTLNLSKNQLQQIDLTKNTNLWKLQLQQNRIKKIDLSNNTKLQDINLSQNCLEQIDLSNNKALSQVTLNGNSLQQIDLSSNTNLLNLFLSHNQLSYIDLRNHQRLQFLHLDQNQFQKIDLSPNHKMRDLKLQRNRLKQVSCHLKFPNRIYMYLANQNSEKCEVKLLLSNKEDLQQSQKVIEEQSLNYEDSKSNQHQCKYIFVPVLLSQAEQKR